MLAAVAASSEIAFRSERPLAYLVFPALVWAGAALRPPRRDARDRGRGRLHRLEHHPLPRSVRLRLDHAQRPQRPSSTSRWRRSRRCASPPWSPSAERFAERLDASRARLVNASDTERRRLEHNLHDGAQQRLTALAIRLGLAAERARDAHEADAPVARSSGHRGDPRDRRAARARATESIRRCSPTTASRPRCESVAARSTVPVALLRAALGALRRERRGDRVLRVRRGGHQRAEARATPRRYASAPSRRPARFASRSPTTASAAPPSAPAAA